MEALPNPWTTGRGATFAAIALYAMAYGGSVEVLGRAPGFAAGESAAVLVVFGLGFTAIAWAATRGIDPAPVSVRRPQAESLAILAYLAAFSVLFLGFGLSALKDWIVLERIERSAILGAKLAAMVVLPAWLFLRMGNGIRELFRIGSGQGAFGWVGGRRAWRALAILCALVLVLQFTVGRGPRQIALLQSEWGWTAWQLVLVAPLAFAWMTLEAGLTEEFLFRVLLQTRLEAWLGNQTAAILGMSVLFGLAHAPGYVLRGGHLWARTRSLGLVVLLHGFTDLVPSLAPFARTWFG